MTVGTLRAPVLLVSMPQVMDPFFAGTVVLLVHHDEEGSLGYIINRTLDLKVSDIFEGVEAEWNGDDDVLANFGGPVQVGLVAVLCRLRNPRPGSWAFSIPPDLYVTGNSDDLKNLAVDPPDDMRLVVGYSGWGPQQIDGEFERGDWLIAEPDPDLVFHADLDEIWPLALRSIGVDPASLPLLDPGMAEPEVN